MTKSTTIVQSAQNHPKCVWNYWDMYNFYGGLGRMRSGDVCICISVCGDMYVRGDWETDECKQFGRLAVYERSGMEESAKTRASVYQWIF